MVLGTVNIQGLCSLQILCKCVIFQCISHLIFSDVAASLEARFWNIDLNGSLEAATSFKTMTVSPGKRKLPTQ